MWNRIISKSLAVTVASLVAVLFVFLPLASIAAGGGHGDEHGISSAQLKTIIYQTINVTVIFVGLIYFTRAGIQSFMASRQKAYIEAKEKAFSALRKAEQDQAELKDKLAKISSTRTETVSRAHAEAAEMKKSIVSEAQQLSAQIRREAEESSRIEVEKAKSAIREFMVTESVNQARQALKSQITESEHKKLNVNFISNLEAPRA